MSETVFAADVGGTKVNIGAFDVSEQTPRLTGQGRLTAAQFENLEDLLRKAFGTESLRGGRACFAVAGPVQGRVAKLTNLPWVVDADRLESRLGLRSVQLLNDLEATAWALPSLTSDGLVELKRGRATPGGNLAVIAAGTGLGQAGVVVEGSAYLPFATEGGHADFGPNSQLEVELYETLARRFGHVSYERLVCGEGLLNIARFVFDRHGGSLQEWLHDQAAVDPAAAVSAAGIEGANPRCREALRLFASVLGAQAGNLALALGATGGVYVAGGIPPKIKSALQDGTFVDGFLNKGRMKVYLEPIPVFLIEDQLAPLRGAAQCAAVIDSTSSQKG